MKEPVVTGWLGRIDNIYLKKGYLEVEDLGLPKWLGRLIFWFGVKTGNFIRCSTVTFDGKVICFHSRSRLLGHAHYPKATANDRFTTDLEYFKSKIWPKKDNVV